MEEKNEKTIMEEGIKSGTYNDHDRWPGCLRKGRF